MKKFYATLIALMAITHCSYAQWITTNTTETGLTGNKTSNGTWTLGALIVPGTTHFGSNISLGSGPAANLNFNNSGQITGATSAYQFYGNGVIQSDVTNAVAYYYSNARTVAASFNLGTLYHYQTNQIAFNAGSSVTNQVGFNASAALSGATNNYGFRGQLTAGTGRYNLYMSGTAPNYLAGNLGIGTNSPSAPLDVRSSANSSWSAQITNNGTTDAHGLYVNIGSGSTGIPFRVDVNGANKLQVSNDGNVGIGTPIPAAKLDVTGNSIFRGFQNDVGLVSQIGFINGYSNGNIKSGIGAITEGNLNKQGLYFFTSNDGNVGTEKVRISVDGNVGIGTTTPKETLSVNGNIRSKQVKVETANWPDYVFKSGYSLPSLKDVKIYIEKYQRLPEMPSQFDVANNGLNLGEIVKLQTKKIEELTLYAIDQQKQIEQLKKDQEARIAVLEKALFELAEAK